MRSPREFSNRRWNHRPQLYRGKAFYLRQIYQLFAILAVFTLTIGTSIYLNQSEALLVRHVRVYGHHPHVSERDIITLTELKKDDKLFSVQLSQIADNISRHPWIDSVRVRREFPDTIQIHVTEKTPVAILEAGDFFLVDDEANVFKKITAHDNIDLPVISGFLKNLVDKFPHLARLELKKTLALLKELSQQPFYQTHQISEIHFDSVLGYTVYTLQDSLEIYYGRDFLQSKHTKLEKFVQSSHFDAERITRVDLDPANKVVVRGLSVE